MSAAGGDGVRVSGRNGEDKCAWAEECGKQRADGVNNELATLGHKLENTQQRSVKRR